MWKIKNFKLLFSMFVLLWIVGTVSAQSTAIDSIFVANINHENFPDVSLTVRAFDDTNTSVTELNPNDIAVYENESQVLEFMVSQGTPLPNYVYFIVDRQKDSGFQRYDSTALLEGLDTFVKGEHFQEGVDTIALGMTDSAELSSLVTLVEPTKSGNSFRSGLTSLNFSADANSLRSLEAIEHALNQMVELAETAQGNISIVYLGTGFDGGGVGQQSLIPDVEALATTFQEKDATFHAIHTRLDFDAFDNALLALVNGTGGQQVVYEQNRDNLLVLKELYELIESKTGTFQIDYRSQNGESGDRVISVVPTTKTIADAASTLSYRVDVAEPTITILEPAADQIKKRVGVQQEDGSYLYNEPTVIIKAQLNWQDAYPRELLRAELLINGQPVGATGEIIAPASTEFSFVYDISDITSTSIIPFAVQARDELGMTVSSEQRQLTIEVEQVAPTEEVTLIVETREVVIEAPPVEVIKTPCEENPRGGECISTTYLPWAVGIGSLLALLFVTISFRRQLAQLSQNAGGVVSNVVQQVRKTILGGNMRGSRVIARMKVITARRDLLDQEIDIYTHTTSFGRDPKLCDVQLYDEDDKSTVSGLHCTLQYNSSTNIFYLTDDNSSAGTKVNDERIPPNDPIQLEEGDEIILGDLFRRGAKLRFTLPEGSAEKPVVEEEDDEHAFGIYDDTAANDAPFATLNDERPDGSTLIDHDFADDPKNDLTVIDSGGDDEFDFDYSNRTLAEPQDEDTDWLDEFD